MSDVDWNGRTFGQLTADEKRLVTQAAGRQLSEELTASADAISAVLAQPLPGEVGLNDKVRFPAMADPLAGDESRVMVEGIVVREPWGTKAQQVTIRTLEAKPRTFVRLISDVEVIAKAML